MSIKLVQDSIKNLLQSIEEQRKEYQKMEGKKFDDSKKRKDMPLFSGVLMYFPDALLAIAEHSKKGNDKHNPGQPLHWAKEKSSDQADCIARHLIDIGPNWDNIDPELNSFHATALAWRALALLQTVIDRKKNNLHEEINKNSKKVDKD